MSSSDTVNFDSWTLHRASGELEKDGARVRLQDLPLQVFKELLARPGELVTREHLIATLWPTGVVDFDTSLNSAVRKLRAALSDDADTPRYIETVPRRGYRFIGKLTEPTASDATDAIDRSASSIRSGGQRKLGWALVATALIAAAVAVYFLRPSPMPPRLRIAVLPFENLSPDPANAFFADGLHEEVLGTLANRATSMEVISRTTMQSYKKRPATVAELVKDLNVTHVLEGSLRRDTQTVRLTLQLIDARADKHMWSHNFDRTLATAMNMQADVAEEVAAQLSARLLSPTSSMPMTADAEAYDLYLKARQLMPNAGTPVERFQEMESLLDRSLARDPTFARALLLRARLHSLYFSLNMDSTQQRLDLARVDIAAARRIASDDVMIDAVEGSLIAAVELDIAKALSKVEAAAQRGAPEALFTKAMMLDTSGRLAEANVIVERLIQLDPRNLFYAQEMVQNLNNEGRFIDAIRFAKQSPTQVHVAVMRPYSFIADGDVSRLPYLNMQLPPEVSRLGSANAKMEVPPSIPLTYAMMMRHQRRYIELKEVLAQVREDSIHPGAFEGYAVLSVGRRPVAEYKAWVELLLGNQAAAAHHGEAVLEFAQARKNEPWNAWFLHMLEGEGKLFIGDREGAIASVRASLQSPPQGNNNLFTSRYRSYLAATVLAWAGQHDEAVTLLEQITSAPPLVGPAIVAREPLFSVPLKGNTRYQALEKRLEADIERNRSNFKALP